MYVKTTLLCLQLFMLHNAMTQTTGSIRPNGNFAPSFPQPAFNPNLGPNQALTQQASFNQLQGAMNPASLANPALNRGPTNYGQLPGNPALGPGFAPNLGNHMATNMGPGMQLGSQPYAALGNMARNAMAAYSGNMASASELPIATQVPVGAIDYGNCGNCARPINGLV